MATMLGNSAKLGLGATPDYIQNHVSIEWDPGTHVLVPSSELGESVPTLRPGSKSGATISITCNKNREDTNGQIALETAASGGTMVDFTLAPEGTTTGSQSITGSAYVETIGAETLAQDQMVTKTYVLKVSGDYTESTFI